MGDLIDKAINAIIRPPRREYDPSALPLFLNAGDKHEYVRHPLNFSNQREQKIVGSIYLENGRDIMDGGPCIIYMHGNASSQLEGQFLVPNICPYGAAVYCFDFAGCGASDGDFISLGYYETEDVEFLMNWLESTFGLGPFVLWGRSMGAATAVLARHPKLVGIVVDSTFTSISDVCAAIAKSQKLPSIAIKPALWVLKKLVKGKAEFDIGSVSPLEMGKKPGVVPMVLGHATDDEFIPIEQGRAVFKEYAHHEKKMMHLTGGHNGRRPPEWITLGVTFALKQLLGHEIENFKPSTFYGFTSNEDHQHFANYAEMVKGKRPTD